jgi:hypothetical protein
MWLSYRSCPGRPPGTAVQRYGGTGRQGARSEHIRTRFDLQRRGFPIWALLCTMRAGVVAANDSPRHLAGGASWRGIRAMERRTWAQPMGARSSTEVEANRPIGGQQTAKACVRSSTIAVFQRQGLWYDRRQPIDDRRWAPDDWRLTTHKNGAWLPSVRPALLFHLAPTTTTTCRHRCASPAPPLPARSRWLTDWPPAADVDEASFVCREQRPPLAAAALTARSSPHPYPCAGTAGTADTLPSAIQFNLQPV